MIQVNGVNRLSTRDIQGGSNVTYDDLQVSISGAKIPAGSTAAWTAITLGGLATELIAFQVGDYLDLLVQTNHSVALSTLIDNHIHWTIATDDNGKKFQMEISGCGAAIGSAFTTIGATLQSGDVTLNNNAGKHNYLMISDIPNTFNSTVSTIFIIRLKRIAATDAANETARLIYLLFNDCHVSLNSFGSLQETSKT